MMAYAPQDNNTTEMYFDWLFLDEEVSSRVNSVIQILLSSLVESFAMSWISDLAAIVRGLQRVNRAFLGQRQNELHCFWSNSSLRPVARAACDQFEDVISNLMLRQSASVSNHYSVNSTII